MIDTVVLHDIRRFAITQADRFIPEFKARAFYQLSDNERARKDRPFPTQSFRVELKPKLWVIPKVQIFEHPNLEARMVEYTMRIECSIPKLMWRNNLVEVPEVGATMIIEELKRRLAYAGIDIDYSTLANASVRWVHFGKNILLPPELQLLAILDELSKMTLNKVFATTRVKFTDGDALQFYSGTRECAFYDKVSDMHKPKNKSIDKLKVEYEKELVQKYGLKDRQILRYEHRLKNSDVVRREINTVLGRPMTTTVTLKDVLSPDVGKKMVQKTWEYLINRPANQLALIAEKSKMAILEHVLNRARASGIQTAHSQNRALISLGLIFAIKECGAKVVLNAIKTGWSDEHPERLDEKIETAVELVEGLAVSDAVIFLNEQLGEFKPITLALLENRVQ